MALFEVIRKIKDDENIVFKYPKTNFNTGSQLVVEESQEALFFSEGKALDLFGAGKYTLSTNNIPLLRNLLNLLTGGKTPFTCQVYFIDISEKKSKWGTPSKIEFLEPMYKFPIQIGASGEFRFKVVDSRKLILKLVGIKKDFTAENIDDFFSSQILVKVKSYIANSIKENNISIFEIDSKLEEMSEFVKNKLNEDFLEYGIELNNFFITTVVKPEDDKQYQTFKELYFKQGVGVATALADKQIAITKAEMEAEQQKISSQARAISREQEGYTYQEEKQLEIGKEVAKNNAVGQFTNVGVGLGMMTGVSGTIGESVSKQVTGAFVKVDGTCPSCGTANEPGVKFCKKCGTSLTSDKVCSECGSKLANDAIFCSQCGKKVA